jgi:hypothetical protein
VLWRIPLDKLVLDETGRIEPRALFISNLVIVAVGRPGGADVLVLDRLSGRPSVSWRYPLPNGDDADVAQVRLAPGRLDTTLQVVIATSRREAVLVEVELPTFEIYREQIVPLAADDSAPLWADLVSASFGLSAGPVATVQTPDGELRYAVGPYLRAVAIVDGVRNVIAGQYTLDISAVAPPGPLPDELRGTALDWPAGQLSPDGRTLYIAGPLRETPAGRISTIWEIDVATWAVRRELPLAEPGLVTTLALGNAGSTLYLEFQPLDAAEANVLSMQTDAAAPAVEEPAAGYTITGSIADLYQEQHGRAPSVAGLVPGQPPTFEGLPRAVLTLEPTSVFPEEEVTVRLTFLASSGDPLTPEQTGVRFDPTASITVLLASGAAQQLVVLGQEAFGVYSADVRLTEPGIWDAVATIGASGVAHWTVEQPGVLVVRSGLEGSDGLIYWPAITIQPDPLTAGSTGWLSLRLQDLVIGTLLPAGVSFEQGVPTSIQLSFINDAGEMVYETMLLRAGPGLFTGLITTPAEGRYRLQAELTYPAGNPELIALGVLTVAPSR